MFVWNKDKSCFESLFIRPSCPLFLPAGYHSHHSHQMNRHYHFQHCFPAKFLFLIIISKRWTKILEVFLKMIRHDGKINAKWNIYIYIYLWETPSFPEPEVAFTISPALPPGVPLDFLAEARSFASGPFPSSSVFVGATVGVYKIKWEKRRC